MEQVTAQFISLFIGIIVFFVLADAFKQRAVPCLKGRIGESRVNSAIRSKLDSQVYHLIQDLTLPTHDGTTQIDHVVVSRYGIFVIETKMYKGWIFGGEKQAKWTQQIYRHKERFQNPLRQNLKHIKTLAALTTIPESFFKSVVVFAGEAQLKTEMPGNVLYLRKLIGYIGSFREGLIFDWQVPEIANAITAWAGTVTVEQKRQHVSNLQKNHQPVAVESTAPVCPHCGTQMLLRKRKKDGVKFWGCPAFPKCRGTRQAA